MNIEKFIPSPQLRPYIKQYYLVEGDFGKKATDVFFADGCLEIVFNLEVDFYRNNKKEPWAKVIGQITQPLHVKATGKGKSFGIWFYPHGFSQFSKIPASELTNTAVPLDLIFDTDFIDAVGNRLVNDNITELINGVNTHFEGLLTDGTKTLKDSVAQHAVQRLIHSDEELSLNELAAACNISHRYLQKIFLERIGLSPKQFQRVTQFQQALDRLNSPSHNSLTTVAYDAGYFDQSHFIREFKRFTGFAPSQYRLENHPINRYFLTP